ncbi:unnamed protein product [Thelazia callipaeda]|uniref:DENN domain-containing protein n=1 Tax=Thelazia callipaeda TaxID=103827 RepID=A0A0N5CN56_THECL|nr:unnamed protein product [Thelazia callipaeda]
MIRLLRPVTPHLILLQDEFSILFGYKGTLSGPQLGFPSLEQIIPDIHYADCHHLVFRIPHRGPELSDFIYPYIVFTCELFPWPYSVLRELCKAYFLRLPSFPMASLSALSCLHSIVVPPGAALQDQSLTWGYSMWHIYLKLGSLIKV